MADLKFIGRFLGAIGGLIMLIIGIISVINNVLGEIVALGLLGLNFVGDTIGGDFGWIIAAAIMIICGLIAIYGYQQLASKGKGDLLVWGIIYIVLGIIGAGLGGLLVLIAGIVLLLDNFI